MGGEPEGTGSVSAPEPHPGCKSSVPTGCGVAKAGEGACFALLFLVNHRAIS